MVVPELVRTPAPPLGAGPELGAATVLGLGRWAQISRAAGQSAEAGEAGIRPQPDSWLEELTPGSPHQTQKGSSSESHERLRIVSNYTERSWTQKCRVLADSTPRINTRLLPPARAV